MDTARIQVCRYYAIHIFLPSLIVVVVGLCAVVLKHGTQISRIIIIVSGLASRLAASPPL